MNWQWLKELFSGNSKANPPAKNQESVAPPAVQQPGVEPDYTSWGDDFDVSSEKPFHRNPDGKINIRH